MAARVPGRICPVAQYPPGGLSKGLSSRPAGKGRRQPRPPRPPPSLEALAAVAVACELAELRELLDAKLLLGAKLTAFADSGR